MSRLLRISLLLAACFLATPALFAQDYAGSLQRLRGLPDSRLVRKLVVRIDLCIVERLCA
jgi:hypothetical protein